MTDSDQNQTNQADILIVDDEEDIRNLIQGILEDEGYTTRLAGNAKEAYSVIEEKTPDMIILDIWLQGSEHDGLEILSNVKERYAALPVVMISGHGTIETAVSSIKKGAYDFIEKPFKSDRLLMMVRRALEAAALRRENSILKQGVKKPAEFVGKSPAIENLREILERAAPTNSRVLIAGEAGSGKNIAARFIHSLSNRCDKPFLALNCATLHPEKFESELFGSANPNKKEEGIGLLEKVNGGTLLLDEVADMPLESQGKIVRIIQDSSFNKVGGQTPIHVDVRFLASTNHDLQKLVEEGKFREDLYYRLNVVPVRIPSLRERIQDIESLIAFFSKELSENTGLTPKKFSSSAIATMQAYDWKGNARQLRNVLEWVYIMHSKTDRKAYDAEDLPPEIRGKDLVHGKEQGNAEGLDLMGLSLRDAREAFEKEYLQSQINRFGGNISKTAQFVCMERSALHRKLKSLDIASSGKELSTDNIENNKTKKRA